MQANRALVDNGGNLVFTPNTEWGSGGRRFKSGRPD
jgi:hypothetical protein